MGNAPIQIPTDVASKASTTIIESGVLGALLIISVLANIVLVWVLVRTMNQRVEDTKSIAEVSEKMVKTFADVNGTLEGMNDDQKAEMATLNGMNQILNTILMSIMTRQGMASSTNLPPHASLMPPKRNGEEEG